MTKMRTARDEGQGTRDSQLVVEGVEGVEGVEAMAEKV